MIQESIGCIGGGRVVRILLRGWKRAGVFPDNVIVSDPDWAAFDAIVGEFPSIRVVQDNNALAAGQDMVFLAVHPLDAGKILDTIAPSLRPDAIVISLMPGLTIAQIVGMLGGFGRVVRMIPNAPSMVMCGYTPVAFSGGMKTGDMRKVESLLEPLGRYFTVPEGDLEELRLFLPWGRPTCGSSSMNWRRSPHHSGSHPNRPPTLSGRWRRGPYRR